MRQRLWLKTALPMALCAMALTMAACGADQRPGPGPASQYAALPTDGWRYGQPVDLELVDSQARIGDSIALADTLLHGRLAVGLRWRDTYQYANVWLEVKYHDGDTLRADTANITLADDFGTWQGTGLGTSWQRVDTILPSVTINRKRPVTLRHIMRQDTLAGIEQIGVFLIPN